MKIILANKDQYNIVAGYYKDLGYTGTGISVGAPTHFPTGFNPQPDNTIWCDSYLSAKDTLSFSTWEKKHLTTKAVKYDNEKPRMDLIDPCAITEISKALTYGAEKYDDHNYKKGLKWSRMYAAALRHIFAWWDGEDKDPESGLSHLAHVGACVFFLLWHEKNKPDMDDRWSSK